MRGHLLFVAPARASLWPLRTGAYARTDKGDIFILIELCTAVGVERCGHATARYVPPLPHVERWGALLLGVLAVRSLHVKGCWNSTIAPVCCWLVVVMNRLLGVVIRRSKVVVALPPGRLRASIAHARGDYSYQKNNSKTKKNIERVSPHNVSHRHSYISFVLSSRFIDS